MLSRHFAIVAALLVSAVGLANREHEVTTGDGRRPYLIVDDGEGPSRREPGIYAADEAGRWFPILPGRVLGGRLTQGIVGQLELTQLSQRHEALVVRDGKLVLFSVNTRSEDPTSYVVLGSEQAPLIDLMSDSLLDAPSIESLENLSVYRGHSDENGQLVLVSMKLKERSLHGDGVTVALHVKRAGSGDAKLELSGSPSVIDYRFQDVAALRLLAMSAAQNTVGTAVLSRLQLQSIARPRPGDPPSLQTWRHSVRDGIAKLDRGQLVAGLPYLDIRTAERRLPALIQDFIAHNNDFLVFQAYDALAGRDGIAFRPAAQQNVPITHADYAYAGRIDIDPRTSRYRLYWMQNVPELFLGYINGELHTVIVGPRPLFLKLDAAAKELPDEIAYYPLIVPQGEGRRDIYLLLSTKSRSGERTEVLALRQNGASYELIKRFEIWKQFLSAEELAARAVLHGKNVLFDNRTPRQRSVEAYQQIVQETMPYLDLTLTQKPKEPIQSYRKPLDEKELSQFLHYRVFDPEGALKPQTGLFLLDRDRATLQIFSGELLQRPQQAQPELATKKFRFKKGDTSIPTRFVLSALDASFTHGSAGFKLVLAVNYDGPTGNPEEFAPFAFDVQNFTVPFSQLAGVYLAQVEKKANDIVYLLLAFDKAANGAQSTLPNGGVYLIPMKCKHERNNDKATFSVEKQKMRWLHQTALSASELERRVLLDKDDGRLYFATNPEVGETSSSYRVSDMFLARDIMPNSSAERKKKLVPFMQTKDETEDSFGSRTASWEVWYPTRLKDRYPKLVPDLGEKALDSLLDENEKLFPILVQVLDALATPSQPPKHQVFLIPPELKERVMKAVYALWAQRERSRHPWQYTNHALKLFIVDQTQASQDEVLKNLEALRGTALPDRAVLLADMAEVLQVGNPGNSGEEEIGRYQIVDPASPPGEEPQLRNPHLLHLIAAEGEKAELKEIRARRTMPKRFGTVLFATPAEWDQVKADFEAEAEAGVFDHFEVNPAFYHANWRVWPPGTPLASARVKAAVSRPVSQFEKEVFPTLAATLSQSADPSRPARHRVLLVPNELKANILSLALTRWVHGEAPRDAAPGEHWSRKNPNLYLYQLDAGHAKTQTTILENLEALRLVPAGSRGVLVADLHDISQLGRGAEVPEGGFQLQELELDKDEETNSGEPGEFVVEHTPHLLYLIASEGRRLQLKEFEDSAGQPLTTSTLLVGTHAEWEHLQKELNPESRAGLAERFVIEELPVPSQAARLQLLRRVLERSDISGLRYRFEAARIVTTESGATPELSPDEARDAVLAYMVTRCETLARSQGKEVITSFIQYMTTFANSLVHDDVVRRRRVIDKVTVERLFSKIFVMPLSTATLPDDDPLVRLSRPHAVVELGAHGHFGAIDMKMRVLQTLLSQTVGDPVKAIPSSIIMFGETRTGKTLLFKSICKMAGLKMYDFAKPSEAGAQAIIINVGKLRPDPQNKKKNEDDDDDESAPSGDLETMTVSDAVRHLHQFLSLPNGYRGHILFDDVHAAPEAVRSRFITEIRALFEANGGMFRVKPFSGTPVEIPVRNLSLYMTLNPEEDWEKRRKYSSDLYGSIIASLAGEGVPIDKSFLERWSLILNMSQFPLDAKAPKLRDSLRETSRETFNNQNMLVIVSPPTVQMVAKQFAGDNANFISRATPPLLARAAEAQSGSALYIITPRDMKKMRFLGDSSRPGQAWDEARDGSEMDAFIRANIVAIPVRERYDGQIEMLKIAVDTYRTHLLEAMLRATTSDMRFAGSMAAQRRLLTPFLHAVMSHLSVAEYLPPHVLRLDPYDFGAVNERQQELFRRALEDQPGYGQRHFPFLFGDEIRMSGLFDQLTGLSPIGREPSNRALVLSEYVDKLLPEMQAFKDAFLRTRDGALPTPGEWLRSLGPQEPTEPARAIGAKLADHFFQFTEDMYRQGLHEMTNDGFNHPNAYDVVRMYLNVIDKTITKLAWGRTTAFLVRSLELASRDMALGQLQGVQHYLFNSQFSLIRPITHEMLMQMATSSGAYREWKEDTRDRMARDYVKKCPDLLVQRNS